MKWPFSNKRNVAQNWYILNPIQCAYAPAFPKYFHLHMRFLVHHFAYFQKSYRSGSKNTNRAIAKFNGKSSTFRLIGSFSCNILTDCLLLILSRLNFQNKREKKSISCQLVSISQAKKFNDRRGFSPVTFNNFLINFELIKFQKPRPN